MKPCISTMEAFIGIHDLDTDEIKKEYYTIKSGGYIKVKNTYTSAQCHLVKETPLKMPHLLRCYNFLKILFLETFAIFFQI